MLLPKRHRFTVSDFHKMAEAGVLGEDDRVELIEGEIVEMAPIGSRHASVVKRLLRLFSLAVGEEAIVSVQDPIRLSRFSEPQPDLALLKPRADFYATAHPGPEDTLLVVEVAESSAVYDRKIKVPLYARHGIPEVWLVDVEEEVVEVYRFPQGESYQEILNQKRGDRLTPQLLPDVAIAVEELFC